MAEFKEGMKKHVSAAREWLGKAERSFDQKNDVRGDLSLMLAQAELQHAKETKKSGKKCHSALGELLLRTFAVVGIVSVVLIIAWDNRPELFRVPPVPNVVPVVGREVQNMTTQQKSHGIKLSSEEMPEVSSEPVESLPPAAQANPPSSETELPVAQAKAAVPKVQKQDVEVTPEQFRQLMRAAGKSLRGD